MGEVLLQHLPSRRECSGGNTAESLAQHAPERSSIHHFPPLRHRSRGGSSLLLCFGWAALLDEQRTPRHAVFDLDNVLTLQSRT